MTLTHHHDDTLTDRCDRAAKFVAETVRLHLGGSADRCQLARALDDYDTAKFDLLAGFERPLHHDGTPCFAEMCAHPEHYHPTGVRP